MESKIKHTHQSYCAYKYTFKGVEYCVFNARYNRKVRWYFTLLSHIYLISEMDGCKEYSTKKQCKELAEYFILSALNLKSYYAK